MIPEDIPEVVLEEPKVELEVELEEPKVEPKVELEEPKVEPRADTLLNSPEFHKELMDSVRSTQVELPKKTRGRQKKQ